jgi:hypothetical protein
MSNDNTQGVNEPSPASAGYVWSPSPRAVTLRCKPTHFLDGVDLLGFARDDDRGRYIARVSWKQLTENDQYFEPQPTMRLSMENAQELMDDLWASGVRPTEGNGSAGAMRAAERHIEDLRKVAFKALGIG